MASWTYLSFYRESVTANGPGLLLAPPSVPSRFYCLVRKVHRSRNRRPLPHDLNGSRLFSSPELSALGFTDCSRRPHRHPHPPPSEPAAPLSKTRRCNLGGGHRRALFPLKHSVKIAIQISIKVAFEVTVQRRGPRSIPP